LAQNNFSAAGGRSLSRRILKSSKCAPNPVLVVRNSFPLLFHGSENKTTREKLLPKPFRAASAAVLLET
jgi:hypothetical protein